MTHPRQWIAHRRFLEYLLIIGSLIVLLFANQSSQAQLSTTGTINGTVTDQTGTALPGASVTITSTETRIVTKTTSNSAGKFSQSGLANGIYSVEVSAPSFSRQKETGIYLEPAAVYTVNVALKVGETNTTVTVSANSLAVQTATSEISGTISGEEAEDLPLDGRNYEGLTQLMPGVINTSPDAAMGPGGYATGNFLNVDGGGITGTFYTLDGIWNENTGSMGATTINPNPDEIEEIKVMQNNYEPKYSLMGESVVLVQTKSGTNEFHGGAWEFLRNTDLDARNYFIPAATGRSAEHWNIFGWQLGGPLLIPHHYNTNKDKTFFYWNQQWIREITENVTTGQSPLGTMRGMGTPGSAVLFPMTGLYGTAFLKDPAKTGNCNAAGQSACFGTDGNGNYVIPANRVNSSQLALLNTMASLPNYTTSNATNFINSKPMSTPQLDEEVKVDQNITPRFRLMGEFFYESQNGRNPASLRMGSPYPANYDIFLEDNDLAQVQLTQIYTPTMTNQTSIAMNRYVITHGFGGITASAQVPGYTPSFPYAGGYLENELPHVTFSGGWSQFGTSANNWQPNANDLEDTISDDWSWEKGKHFIQIGGNLVFGTKRQWASVGNTTGDVSFTGYATGNPMADYLLGNAATFYQSGGGVRKAIHYTITSPYFEDRWTASRRLTFTGGLRLFRMPFPAAQPGFTAPFLPSLFNPSNVPTVSIGGILSGPNAVGYSNGIELAGENGVPRNITNEHNYYVAPMAGFALDVFGDGKTAIRGGLGYAYNRNAGMGAACSQGCVQYPVLNQTSLVDVNFPNVTGGVAAPPTAPGVSGMPLDYQVAMIKSWSLSVEQQLPGKWFVSVAGALDRANHLSTSYNINQPPATTVGGVSYDFNPNLNLSGYTPAFYAPYQGYGAITWFNPIGIQKWSALEVSLKHSVMRHLFVTVAYTWSHNLDNAGGFQNPYNLNLAYGNSNLDTPQVLAFSVIYNLPQFHSGWRQSVLGGWKYSDMTTIQSGTFSTFAITGSNLGPITHPNLVGKLTYPRQWKPSVYGANAFWFNPGTTASPVFARPANGNYGTIGNGTELGPGISVSNMAVYKTFQVDGRLNLQFRAEFFNIFNHTNPSGPNVTFGASTFGVVTAAQSPRIGEMSLELNF